MFIPKHPSVRSCAVIALCLASTVVIAAETQSPIDKTTQACMDKNSSTLGMRECLDKAFKEWDKELNKVYNTLLKELSATGKENLKNSQKQWLTYRDAEFKAIGAIYDLEGTLWPLTMATARNDVLKYRVLTLQGYLAGLHPEGEQ